MGTVHGMDAFLVCDLRCRDCMRSILRRHGRELRRNDLWIGGRVDMWRLRELSWRRRASLACVIFGCLRWEVETRPLRPVSISKSKSSKCLHKACKTAPPATATVIAKGKPVKPNSRLRIFLRPCNAVLVSERLVLGDETKERRAGPRESERARV